MTVRVLLTNSPFVKIPRQMSINQGPGCWKTPHPSFCYDKKSPTPSGLGPLCSQPLHQTDKKPKLQLQQRLFAFAYGFDLHGGLWGVPTIQDLGITQMMPVKFYILRVFSWLKQDLKSQSFQESFLTIFFTQWVVQNTPNISFHYQLTYGMKYPVVLPAHVLEFGQTQKDVTHFEWSQQLNIYTKIKLQDLKTVLITEISYLIFLLAISRNFYFTYFYSLHTSVFYPHTIISEMRTLRNAE